MRAVWNIAVCDDEIVYINRLREFLKNEDIMKEIDYKLYEFLSGEEFLEFEYFETLDVIFLDIDMPIINGIEVAKRVREKNKDVIIIFFTNHEQYVKVGYQVQAFRYVSKNDLEELREAVESISAVLEKKRCVDLQDIGGKCYTISYEDIVYAETEARHIKIHLKSETFLMNTTLQELEEVLNSDNFFRSNRSYLINFEHVSNYTSKEIFLDNGESADLSREKKTEFKSKYMQWKFERGNG